MYEFEVFSLCILNIWEGGYCNGDGEGLLNNLPSSGGLMTEKL